jgi:hypothetical protein
MNSNKATKKASVDDCRMTMTAIHKKKMQEFEDELKNLPEKKLYLDQLQNKYKISRNNNEAFYLKKQIDALIDKIYNIENNIDYSEYLINSINYLDTYKNSETNTNKGHLSQMYLQDCFSESLISKETKDELMCPNCEINRIIDKNEAIAICDSCGDVIHYQDGELCTEFSDEIEVLVLYRYRRENHFRERLSMICARESSSPPQDVIDKLLEEFRKNRIYDKSKITDIKVREYLKKLGLNKMYEHIPLIIHKICGTEPPKISKELENELIRMFIEIQSPFEKHKPPERKNFLCYNYCIYKFLEILGQQHLLHHLSLLKNREKLHDQDKLFEKICKELDWKFIPSV